MSFEARGVQPTSEDLMLVLEALLRQSSRAHKPRVRCAIAFIEGERFLVDSHAVDPITPGWSRDQDLTILTNRVTFSDVLQGNFDVVTPGPEHTLIWGGSEATLRRLSDLLRTTNILGLRATSARDGSASADRGTT